MAIQVKHIIQSPIIEIYIKAFKGYTKAPYQFENFTTGKDEK
jgi:hypothetical protein